MIEHDMIAVYQVKFAMHMNFMLSEVMGEQDLNSLLEVADMLAVQSTLKAGGCYNG